MGKEAKLGVALIAVLLGAFGFVLYKQLQRAQPAGEAVASAAEEGKPAAGEREKPKLSSRPLKLTVVQPSAADRSKQEPAPAASAAGAGNSSRYGDYTSSAGSTPTDDSRTSQDPFAAPAGAAGPRYGDRYAGTAQQIYGPAGSDAAEASAAAGIDGDSSSASSSAAPDRADPFSRYGNRNAGGTLTPTADASAALLPASATSEDATEQAQPDADRGEAATETVAESQTPAITNPLRSAATDSTSAPTARSGPRYDLYGSTPTEAAASEPAVSAETAGTRVRFGQPGSATRYSEPSSPVAAALPDRTASNAAAQPTAADRYSPAAAGNTSTSATTPRRDYSSSGWSGTTATGAGGTSTATANAPPAASSSRTAAPVATQSVPPRTLATASARQGETFVVGANDSFSSISKKVYGTDSYFKALHEHNKARYPRADQMRTGDVVATPSVETLMQKYPALCPKPQHLPPAGRTSSLASQRGGRVYVVEEGDTLFDIARFELGKASRWAEIYELNKDVIGQDFNHLRPGTELLLPSEAQDDTFTRRPGMLFNR